MIFNGKIYNEYETNIIGLDDIVCLNGVIGYVDAIMYDFILLVDDKGKAHRIDKNSIQSAYMLSQIFRNNLSSILLN